MKKNIMILVVLICICFGLNCVYAEDRIHFINVGVKFEADEKDPTKTKMVKLDNPDVGDAILLESNGQYAMIDTGKIVSASSVVEYLKKEKVSHLEFVVISHVHTDHGGGFGAILDSKITVGQVIMKKSGYDQHRKKFESEKKDVSPNYNIYDDIMNRCEAGGIPVNEPPASMILGNMTLSFYNRRVRLSFDKVGKSNQFKKYKTPAENINSLVTYIKVKSIDTAGKDVYHDALLTGDQTNGTILNYVYRQTGKKKTKSGKRVLKYDLYKVSHHGLANLSGRKLVRVNTTCLIVPGISSRVDGKWKKYNIKFTKKATYKYPIFANDKGAIFRFDATGVVFSEAAW